MQSPSIECLQDQLREEMYHKIHQYSLVNGLCTHSHFLHLKNIISIIRRDSVLHQKFRIVYCTFKHIHITQKMSYGQQNNLDRQLVDQVQEEICLLLERINHTYSHVLATPGRISSHNNFCEGQSKLDTLQ